MEGSLMIGYELNDSSVQISFYNMKTKEPESVDPSMGRGRLQIPAVLLKLPDTEEYLVGQEAISAAKDGKGILHDHLLSMASKDFDEDYLFDENPVELLAIFIKRSLRYISMDCRLEDVGKITFTLPSVDKRTLSVMDRLIKFIGWDSSIVTIQDFQESFYSYVVHQKQDLRNYSVALFVCENRHLAGYELFIHRKSFPKVVTVNKFGEIDLGTVNIGFAGGRGFGSRDEDTREMDAQFYRFVEDMFRGTIYSSVYLTGEDFDDNWFPQTLKLLCRGRRVFSGQNLFVKGACYRAMDEGKEEQGTEFLYMGPHKITYNIGMDVMRNGHKEYFGIIQAGINYFEAKGSCEFLLDHEDSIELCIQSIDRSEDKRIRIPLEGLPKRPNKTTRLKLDLRFTGVREVRIDVKDCGFGEWFPATDFTWTERLVL